MLCCVDPCLPDLESFAVSKIKWSIDLREPSLCMTNNECCTLYTMQVTAMAHSAQAHQAMAAVHINMHSEPNLFKTTLYHTNGEFFSHRKVAP